MSARGKLFIKTFGCQMNVADSERMAALLAEKGMTPAKQASDADLILINGCTVREKAVHKALSQLGVYHHEHEQAARNARNEGKPEAALPKIVEGRVNGYFKENVLLEQDFAAIWQGQDWRRLRADLAAGVLGHNCQRCPASGMGSAKASGSFAMRDHTWRRAAPASPRARSRWRCATPRNARPSASRSGNTRPSSSSWRRW